MINLPTHPFFPKNSLRLTGIYPLRIFIIKSEVCAPGRQPALCSTEKIHKSVLVSDKGSSAGEIVQNNKHLIVSCGDGNCIEILNLQVEGKKAMSADDFMRGNALDIGDKFE